MSFSSFTQNVQNNIDALIYGSNLTNVVDLKGIDLYPTEDHTSSISKTNLPLEDGSNITDHAVINPDKITLTGVVSNVSKVIGGVPIFFGGVSIVNNTKSRDAWTNLVALKEARQPLTVVTSLKIYNNMLLMDLKSTVNVKTGTNLYFTADFEQIRFVGTATTQLPPAKLSSIGTTSATDKAGKKIIKQKPNPAANKTSTVNGGERQSREVSESIAAKAQDWLDGV